MNNTNQILITGVNGFIGSHIASNLLWQKYQVLGISIEPDSKIKDPNFTYQQIDIKNETAIKTIFENFTIDTVIHLAAIVHKNTNDLSYDSYYKTNYLASKNIFMLADQFKVKTVLFASTIEVYGDCQEQIIIEETIPQPTSIYAKTKFLAEKELLDHSHNFNYAIMRFAPVYGKFFRFNLNKRIYLIPNKLSYYFKKGDYSFNFCSLNNIIDFIHDYLKSPPKESGIYNISDQKNFPVTDIITHEKKQHKNLILNIKLPFYLTLIIIFCFEKLMKIFSKKDKTISIYNFRKLFKSTVYTSKKALKISKFKWDIINTDN
ncbi:MAG: NAD(P)-dependent oxidoreductase [Candidatus Margulisiibacteriota bacterium]|jgi:nucleoside-diphosphate-sugar epimerase